MLALGAGQDQSLSGILKWDAFNTPFTLPPNEDADLMERRSISLSEYCDPLKALAVFTRPAKGLGKPWRPSVMMRRSVRHGLTCNFVLT